MSVAAGGDRRLSGHPELAPGIARRAREGGAPGGPTRRARTTLRPARAGWPLGRRALVRLLGVVFALAAPGLAVAHLNGIPTIAWPQSPSGVGEIADDSYRITWIDYDDRATTGETTIDIHASRRMPPTYRMGVVPRIEGDPDHLVIAEGIQEKDLRNQVEWDTSSVPAGTWFVWTVAHDDPFEMWAFARGAISVAHGGEPPWPAVIVTRPDENSTVGDESVLLAYEGFDPDGTAAVRLEATRALDGSGLVVIAEDLPADPAGSFRWDTREVEEGDWTIKATITDARGLSSSAFGRSFVRVQHRSKGTGGAGGAGAAAGGGMGGAGGSEADAGDDPGAECGCGAAPGDAVGLVLAALLLLRSKRAGCGSAAPPPA